MGDAALVEMAVLLKQACRTADLLARFGGEEFVLLLPDTPATDADAVRARLRAAVATQNAQPDREYALATSIGIASWSPAPAPEAPAPEAQAPEGPASEGPASEGPALADHSPSVLVPASLPTLLKAADDAMYVDKRARRPTRVATAVEERTGRA